MDNERTAVITIGEEEYTLLLTTKATKEIAGRYGGLENLGEKLMKSENFEMAIGQGAPQGAAHRGCGGASDHAPRPCRIQNRYYGSSLQGHQAECGKRERLKKRTSRVTVSDAELFTRLLYYGLAHLHLSQDEVWLMPFGLLLDLWECHKQYNGQAVPAHEHYIDDIIPDGI